MVPAESVFPNLGFYWSSSPIIFIKFTFLAYYSSWSLSLYLKCIFLLTIIGLGLGSGISLIINGSGGLLSRGGGLKWSIKFVCFKKLCNYKVFFGELTCLTSIVVPPPWGDLLAFLIPPPLKLLWDLSKVLLRLFDRTTTVVVKRFLGIDASTDRRLRKEPVSN